MDPDLPSAVDEVPIGLVVLGVEHHAVVQLEIGRLGRKSPAAEVLRSGHDMADGRAETERDGARVLQRSKANRHINVIGDQIEKEIRDEKVDSNPSVIVQERRYEIQKD